MNVGELRAQLEAFPADAPVDAMFPQGSDAYHVVGVELMQLRDGRKFCIIDITADVPLRAV